MTTVDADGWHDTLCEALARDLSGCASSALTSKRPSMSSPP
jgi:hypothetical protein